MHRNLRFRVITSAAFSAALFMGSDVRPTRPPTAVEEGEQGAIDPNIKGHLGPAANEVLRPIRPEITVGANKLVNDRSLCPNGLGLTQNEPAIAVSGDVVVVAFNDSRGVCDPDHHAVVGWAFSLDAGETWTEGGALPNSNKLNAGDPWLGVSPDGQTFYLSGLWDGYKAFGFYRGAITSGGIQWSDPSVVTSAPAGTEHDKEAFAVDPNSGTIYLTYTRIGRIGVPAGIFAARSDDGGVTWYDLAPVFITSPISSQGSFPIVDNQGNLFVAYQIARALIEVSRSTDGGSSFQTVAGFDFRLSTVPFFDRSSQFPQMAVDRSKGPRDGWIYLAWHQEAKFADATQTAIVHSGDAGSTWSGPASINSDTVVAHHWWPSVSVDGQGNVNAIFLDRRNHPGTGLTDCYFAQSSDGGKTFTNTQVTDVTASWDGIRYDPLFTYSGDYIQAVSQGTSIYAAWPDTRNGDPDIYFARIDFP